MTSSVQIDDQSNKHNNMRQLEAQNCCVCLEELGSHGGQVSLGCGHSGCVECLQQVQLQNIIAQCPICQTPYESENKPGSNPNLDCTLEFEWSGTPKFDAARRDHILGDSQHIDMTFDTDQQFRPCVYEEFNTWTPLTYPQPNSVDETVNGPKSWPSVGDRAIEVAQNGHPNLSGGDVGGEALSCSKSIPLSEAPEYPNASQHPEQGNHSICLEETWTSVHIPSAPLFLSDTQESSNVLRSILEAVPPQWIPDSTCSRCMQCQAKFQPLTRGRHHCRFCGGIFCRSCSKRKSLLPFKFMERDPQRVCDTCYHNLEPVQGFLINMVSNASQLAVHDVTDATCMRGWLNNPIGLSMQDEIYKATNTLKNFCKINQIGAIKSEQKIPAAVLQGAKGLAILTVVKVGMVFTYKVGTGLLIARRNDGSWSPPAAIMSCGMGWGFQVGGELVDFIVVLRSTKAVKAFSGRMHVSVGAGLSASVGPLGRLAEADVRVGEKGAAACYTYSCSQGAFVGVSFEGNVVASRAETNTRFYGDMFLTPEYILFGNVPTPKAAAPLYRALHDLFATIGC